MVLDCSSITDTESLSTNTSVASILGIKGGLRIRPHPISQKAHVVLRRVESSEDSSDDGQESDVVYFRLFAHKPINLKPGKELLLTVASADGRFKDQVVMFEGNLRGPDEDSDHEGTTQVEEEPQVIEEEEEIIPQSVMPPKMRRQWTKKVEEVSPVVFKVPVAHSSVGVQAQPVYASSSVQANALQNSVSIHVQPSQSIASVQTCSSYVSSAVQADPPSPPSYTSMDIQTDAVLPSVELDNMHQAVAEEVELSPAESPLIIVPPLSIEIPGSLEPSEDMEMSPREDIEETTIQMPSDNLVEEVAHPPVLAHPPSRPPRPVTDMFDLDDSPEMTSIPSRPSKPALQNSFVSGGFIIDFVGEVQLAVKEAPEMEQSEEPPIIHSVAVANSSVAEPSVSSESAPNGPQKAQTRSHRCRAAKRAKLYAETRNASPTATFPSSANSEDATGSGVVAASGGGRNKSTPIPQLLSRSPSPQLVRSPAQNAVASGSRIVVPTHTPLANASILPRAITLNQAKVKAPVTTETQQHKDYIDLTSPRSSTPPPEPRALVHIPAGPSSNPLSIRPSHSSLPHTLARPASSSGTSAKLKKPIVVGRGWPLVRATNSTSTASASSPGPNVSKSSLKTIVGYRSPSPSPPVNPPTGKCKQIDSDTSIFIPQNDDDMVISEPPSPVSGPSLPQPTAGESIPTSAPHRISDDIHDQVVSLEVARTYSVSLLRRISTNPPEQQPTQSSDVSPATSSQKPSSSMLSRIWLDISKVDPPQHPPSQSPDGLPASSSRETSATSSQVHPANSAPLLSHVSSDTNQPSIQPPVFPPASSTQKTSTTSSPANPASSAVNAASQHARRPPSPIQRPMLTSDVPPAGLTQTPSATSSQANPVRSATNVNAEHTRRNSSQQKKHSLIQLPTHHPLPAKPPPPVPQNNPLSYGLLRGIKRERPPSPDLWTAPDVVRAQQPQNSPPSYGPPRGIKRERPPSPDLWTAPGVVRLQQPQRRKQQRRWPTVEWTHLDMLKGDGDPGIRRIAFNSDGSSFALSCMDQTLRIWNSKTRLEIARLTHNSQVIGLVWLDGDGAVLSLGEDGVLGKWTKIGHQNHWQWARVLNVDENCTPEDTVCLTYARDRIAVAFPKTGVKVWIWSKGSWRPQRSIMRTNVTALKFIDGGDALLGGTREGVVWHCAVPNGTMKVYAFLQSSITSIAVNRTGMQALIAQAGGSACFVSLRSQDEKRVGKSFLETDLHDGSAGAVFSTEGKTVIFGKVDGCLLVWDAQNCAILYGMEYPDGDMIQAVASCDGSHGCVIAGTQKGTLLWWPQPQAPAQGPSQSGRKRLKAK